MSKIIVAIDFLDASINAFLHALSIANLCKHDLLLVWVEKPTSEVEKFGEKVKDPARDAKKAFDELIAKYQQELPDSKITYKIRKGKVYKEIAAEAKESKAVLTVVGTHGASGFEEVFAGSNANKIVTASPCPVITIRGGIDVKRPLSRIVFPIDCTLETRQKANMSGYLAKCHNAEVYILKVYRSKVKDIRQNVDLYASQVARHFDKEGVKYHIDWVETENLANAAIDYAKMIDANLIAIMTEQESGTANLWMGTFAHQTVNHSPVPVLSIRPKETLAAGLGF